MHAHLVAITTCVLMFSGHAAQGHFIGLSLQPLGVVQTAAGPKMVYRLYANFNSGSNSVVRWSGSVANPLIVRTEACNGVGVPGGSFYNFTTPGGGNTAPSQHLVDMLPDARWDTFATIGVNIQDQGSGPPRDPNPNQTEYNLGVPFISGNLLTITNPLRGVSVPDGAAQGRADYLGDGDPQLRVLLMQLTVNLEDGVYCSIGELFWRESPGSPLEMVTNFNTASIAIFGRCCVGGTSCVYTSLAGCAQPGSVWLGCGACGSCHGPCPADIAPPGTPDNNVNMDDLLMVINAWNSAGSAADITNDGWVNIDDLLAVINNWGPCH